MSGLDGDRVLVLDFGSQYTQLIARKVRRLGFLAKIFPCNVPMQNIDDFGPAAIILSGGPSSVFEEGADECDTNVFDLGVPMLGICYGMQFMNQYFGGLVEKHSRGEFGRMSIDLINPASPLFAGCPSSFNVWMSHQNHVSELANGFVALAKSATCIAAAANSEKKLYATQFHPEVKHSENGDLIWRNFLINICDLKPWWKMSSFVETAVASLRRAIGETEHVVMGLSGGVDSSVAAMLLHRAIGSRLHCIFVDNGLLRLREFDEVLAIYAAAAPELDIRAIDASKEFVEALSGVLDPETKRKAIGRVFIEVFEREAKTVANVKYLGQGTIYPDVIESMAAHGGPTAVIKSHHNVGGLPEKMGLSLVEPLRELFKDEVRVLGKEVGLPDVLVKRHPMPGPGLAIRIIGEVTPENLAILRLADAIVVDEIRDAGWYDSVWEAFAVLMPTAKSTGVVGDGRAYGATVAVRVCESEDGMTADWTRLPYDLLGKISSRICNEVSGVGRCVYDISSKPPSTIEWE